MMHHKHKYRNAFIYDGSSLKNPKPRWILMWKCRECPYAIAHGISYEKPGTK